MKNKTMMMDLYELTMAQVYFDHQEENKIVYFDGFFRKIPFDGGYALMGGVNDIIHYIRNLKFTDEDITYLRSLNKFSESFLTYLTNFQFTGDIYMIPDGTPVFENVPLITVKANVIEAQIIETALLSYLNANIKFMTAARRLVEVASDIPVMEFGARRADGPEAAIMASKCAYIAGACGTSNVQAGQLYDIPVMGTMAHSFVTNSDSEYDAFLHYAQTYPDQCTLLVDTYDTLKSGVPNAIRVANDYLIPNGYRLAGIRIDSGDLLDLSIKARKMLDEAGLADAKVCLSNGLDAKMIQSLKRQGAQFDSIGAGDNITAPKERVGVVYKLTATVENEVIVPKIKISGDAIKTTNPGYKKTYRLYDYDTDQVICDVIAGAEEVIDCNQMVLVDPIHQIDQKVVDHYWIRELQQPIFMNGKLVYTKPSTLEVRNYCEHEMSTLREEVKRLEQPDKYRVYLTKALLELKNELIEESRQDEKVKRFFI